MVPCSMGPSPTTPWSSATVPHWLNRLDTVTTTQGIESLSISPSLITLTILPNVQVLTTLGTCWVNSDSSGTTRKTMSLSYPAISFTWTLNITKPSGWVFVPPNPTRFRGWLTRSCSGSMGNSYWLHIIRCHGIHMAATLGQSVDLPAPHPEANQGLWTDPRCHWPNGYHQCSITHHGHMRTYVHGGFYGFLWL